MISVVLLSVALSASAQESLGGHDPAETLAPTETAPRPADERKALLDEMWQRRILPPDHDSPSPQDSALLIRIRRDEDEALNYLKRKPGGVRAWIVERRTAAGTRRLLTREGHARYLALLTQDALAYFESKGADAKWAFKLLDWEGRRLFDPAGKVTDEGIRVYSRAKLNLEVFWRAPTGQVYGTRRPPKDPPPARGK